MEIITNEYCLFTKPAKANVQIVNLGFFCDFDKKARLVCALNQLPALVKLYEIRSLTAEHVDANVEFILGRDENESRESVHQFLNRRRKSWKSKA